MAKTKTGARSDKFVFKFYRWYRLLKNKLLFDKLNKRIVAR